MLYEISNNVRLSGQWKPRFAQKLQAAFATENPAYIGAEKHDQGTHDMNQLLNFYQINSIVMVLPRTASTTPHVANERSRSSPYGVTGRRSVSPSAVTGAYAVKVTMKTIGQATRDGLLLCLIKGHIESMGGATYADYARIFTERLSRRISCFHKSTPRAISDKERNHRREEFRDARFYDEFREGYNGLLLRPENGEVGYLDANNRRSPTREERAVNFKKWFGKLLSEIDGVFMVFWHSPETFGSGGAESFVFDDAFLGANVPHPKNALQTPSCCLDSYAESCKGRSPPTFSPTKSSFEVKKTIR